MFATIYLPNFYLQAALRYQPELSAMPAALIEECENKPLILQLNDAAEASGIRKGMTPSQALARNLKVVIKVRARAQEISIQQILLHFAFTLSPFVEDTAPGIVTIQLAKWHPHLTDHLSSSPDDKLRHGIGQLAQSNITAQIGMADSPDTSFLAANLARPILRVRDPKEFLAPLPIETFAIGQGALR